MPCWQACRKGAPKYDITGMFGCVCDHRILHLAAFIPKGENHRFIVMLLESMAEKKVVPAGALYDIGCRAEAAFHRWSCGQRHFPADVFAALQQLMMIVPPFHAFMHNSDCQAENTLACRRFPGWLKPLGEPAEQLWACLGGQRLKYFTKHHMKLYLEVAFAFLNRRCDERLVFELVKRIQSGTRLVAALRAEVALFSKCSLPAADPAQVLIHVV